MKAVINGLEVFGTPEEIERYRIISQSHETWGSNTIKIHVDETTQKTDIADSISKFFKDTSHIWQ